uniref:Zinc finger, CCHC-type n=1 Tax=Tanacetum cinerariifolium TaxID=118510 RepID=A0A6L2NG71_TANCI|nr:zinc finger, CCHC-type [Tanacetum cinerariifolium]
MVRRWWLMADEDDDRGEVVGDDGMEMAADVVGADEDGGDVMVTAVMTTVVGGDSGGGHGDGGVAVMWLTKILSVLLKITPDLAMRVIGTPLSSPKGTTWFLFDPTPSGSISPWKDLTNHFLAQFFSPERTVKLRNDILMFQQHQGESLFKEWTRFKDLLHKVPHHGIDLWLQV